MILLLLGLALYAGLHLFTTALRSVRDPIVARIGEISWKAVVAIGLIASVWLMVRGYGDASAEALWIAPGWARPLVVVLMLPTFILYMGTHPGSAIGARIRHPQLTAFMLWAGMHLLVNGEFRATILFGGLLAWAVVQLILLDRRDGKPPLPQPNASPLKAWAAIPIGIALWVGLLFAHEWLFGVSPIA